MKKILFILLAVVLALSVGLTGCADDGDGAPDYIRVGTVTYTEGMYAGFGGAGLWSTEQGIKDINALGGVYVEEYGKKILLKLYTRESQGEETTVAGHAEYLIDTDKVHVMVGPCIPPPMVAPTVPVCEEAKIPLVIFPAPYESWFAMIEEFDHTYTFTSNFHIHTPLVPDVPGYLIKDIGFAFHEKLGVTNETDTVGVYASADGDGVAWFEGMGAMLEGAGYQTSTWEDGVGLFPMLIPQDYSAIINKWIADNVTALWGNCPAPFFKDMWLQALGAGLQPRLVNAARAGLFWEDMEGLGENAVGLGLESWWSSRYDPEVCPGFGTTTPQSLHERWVVETVGKQENPNEGWGYSAIQVIVDAIKRAGSLDGTDIRDALATTDLETIAYHMEYDADHSCPCPIHYFQWFWDSELETVVPEVVISAHSFLNTTAVPTFITW